MPGLNGVATGRSLPDVTIQSGAVPNALAGASAIGPTWQIADKQFLLRIREVTCAAVGVDLPAPAGARTGLLRGRR